MISSIFYFSKDNNLPDFRAGTLWTGQEKERQRSPLRFTSRRMRIGHGWEKINVAIWKIHYSKSPSSERTKGFSNTDRVAMMCFCLLQTASVQIPVHAGLMQGSRFGQQSLGLSPDRNIFIAVTFRVEAVIRKQKIVVVFVLYAYVI